MIVEEDHKLKDQCIRLASLQSTHRDRLAIIEDKQVQGRMWTQTLSTCRGLTHRPACRYVETQPAQSSREQEVKYAFLTSSGCGSHMIDDVPIAPFVNVHEGIFLGSAI